MLFVVGVGVAVSVFSHSHLMMPLMFVIWVNYYWLQAISKLQNLCLAQARMKCITQQRCELRIFNIQTPILCHFAAHDGWSGFALSTQIHYMHTKLKHRSTYQWSVLCTAFALQKSSVYGRWTSTKRRQMCSFKYFAAENWHLLISILIPDFILT